MQPLGCIEGDARRVQYAVNTGLGVVYSPPPSHPHGLNKLSFSLIHSQGDAEEQALLTRKFQRIATGLFEVEDLHFKYF